MSLTTSKNDNRANVYELQTYLRRIQMSNGSTSLVNPDGVFGPETTAAVRDFQRQNGLEETGKVDLLSWDKIFAEYMRLGELYGPAEAARIYSAAPLIIKKGDINDEIYVLQVLLKRNHKRLGILSSVTINGIFDDETEYAVKELQRFFGAEETGVVDKFLWNRFMRFNNVRIFQDNA